MTKKQEDWLLDIFKAKSKVSGVVNLDDFYAWLGTEQGKEVMKLFNIEDVTPSFSEVDNIVEKEIKSGVVTLDEDADLPFVGDELDILDITRLSMHCIYAIDNLVEAYKVAGADDSVKISKVLDLMVKHLMNAKTSVEDYRLLHSILEG